MNRSPHQQRSHLSDIVELTQYPLLDLKAATYARVVADAQQSLAENGCCVLPGFLRADVVAQVQKEGEAVAPDAYYHSETVNAYNIDINQSLPPEHPAKITFERGNAFVPRDQIPSDHLIQQLYTSSEFQRFLASCFRIPKLHPLADPLAGLCLNVLQPGKSHPWHFDINEFTVSILTRLPSQGGQFEFCPNIRSTQAENLADVRDLLRGQADARIRRLNLRPGDLQLFCGRYALHRVTPVQGGNERHTAIFAYTREANVIGRTTRTRQLFGRVLPEHEQAERQSVRSDSLLD